MMHACKNERGFTLIEALVAMVILTIGILTLITMQTTALKGNAKARGITTASNWAQDRIEDLFKTEYELLCESSDAACTANPACTVTATGCAWTETSPDGFYTIDWTVNGDILTSVDPVPVGSPPVDSPPLKNIQVTVTRSDFGAQRAITFNYYRQIEL